MPRVVVQIRNESFLTFGGLSGPFVVGPFVVGLFGGLCSRLFMRPTKTGVSTARAATETQWSIDASENTSVVDDRVCECFARHRAQKLGRPSTQAQERAQLVRVSVARNHGKVHRFQGDGAAKCTLFGARKERGIHWEIVL